MAPNLVPFGKYKGQPVEVLAADEEYCTWLAKQDWFRNRYTAIHTLIVNNFAAPEETPDHNALQARFLDPAWREQFVSCAMFEESWTVLRRTPQRAQKACRDQSAKIQQQLSEYKQDFYESYHTRLRKKLTELDELDRLAQHAERAITPDCLARLISKVNFEVKGVDVVLDVEVSFVSPAIIEAFDKSWELFSVNNLGSAIFSATRFSEYLQFHIECKPSLGDDYPAVLRQMRANNSHSLLITRYAGVGATLEQVRAIFAASEIRLFIVADIEAHAIKCREEWDSPD